MATLRELAEEFLSKKHIAVFGVSHTEPGEAANIIYKKLRDSGYTVFAINPATDTVEDDPCYPNLKAVPGDVEAAVVVTRPEVTEEIVRDCAEKGVTHVWMHRSIGNSVSDKAVEFCQANNMTVIPGGCPMMFAKPVDFAHACMRAVMSFAGRIPKTV